MLKIIKQQKTCLFLGYLGFLEQIFLLELFKTLIFLNKVVFWERKIKLGIFALNVFSLRHFDVKFLCSFWNGYYVGVLVILAVLIEGAFSYFAPRRFILHSHQDNKPNQIAADKKVPKLSFCPSTQLKSLLCQCIHMGLLLVFAAFVCYG